jgi:hypothetical protein
VLGKKGYRKYIRESGLVLTKTPHSSPSNNPYDKIYQEEKERLKMNDFKKRLIKKLIFTFFALLLIALGVVALIYSMNITELDHTMQIEEFGYVKSDITLLDFGQLILRNSLRAIGVIDIILGILLLIIIWLD